MSTPTTTRFRKGGTTLANYTATAFANGVNSVLTAGNVITQAQLDALTVPVFLMEDSSTPKATTRGGKAVFYGDAANNTTHEYRVWLAFLIEGMSESDACYILKLHTSGTFTLGTKTGVSDRNAVKTTDRFADTLGAPSLATAASSPVGIGSKVVTAFGGVVPDVDTPADDTVAMLLLPELGNPHAVIFDLKAASGGINALFIRET